MGKNENKFQADLIKELKSRFKGCIVMKNDANYIQGIPDLTVLYKDKWAFLECKKNESSNRQANQDYYIQFAKDSSFGSFIYPENKEEVLNELQRSFESGGRTRTIQSKSRSVD